jgi:hypothetical protein
VQGPAVVDIESAKRYANGARRVHGSRVRTARVAWGPEFEDAEGEAVCGEERLEAHRAGMRMRPYEAFGRSIRLMGRQTRNAPLMRVAGAPWWIGSPATHRGEDLRKGAPWWIGSPATHRGEDLRKGAPWWIGSPATPVTSQTASQPVV